MHNISNDIAVISHNHPYYNSLYDESPRFIRKRLTSPALRASKSSPGHGTYRDISLSDTSVSPSNSKRPLSQTASRLLQLFGSTESASIVEDGFASPSPSVSVPESCGDTVLKLDMGQRQGLGSDLIDDNDVRMNEKQADKDQGDSGGEGEGREQMGRVEASTRGVGGRGQWRSNARGGGAGGGRGRMYAAIPTESDIGEERDEHTDLRL